MAHDYKLWFRSVLAYTIAGCVSAVGVGAVIGTFGRALAGGAVTAPSLFFVAFLGLILAAREWGWMAFRLPERKLQTEKVWAHEFGFVTASAMWGLHIGLGFATRVTYGGFWVLVAVTLALGDPLYGALLMLVYWLGRTLPVWVAPALLAADADAIGLPEAIFGHRQVYHRVVGAALVWSAVVIVLLAMATRST